MSRAFAAVAAASVAATAAASAATDGGGGGADDDDVWCGWYDVTWYEVFVGTEDGDDYGVGEGG